MPNITGTFTAKTYKDAVLPTGCFEEYWYDRNVTPSGTNKDKNTGIEFNASRSNPIYDNSDTVTPESLTTFMLIKY